MSHHTEHSSHTGHDHGAGEVSAEDCADYLERIVYFLDNELDDADCGAVRAHLDSCNPCLVKYDLQRTMKAIVARSCSEAAPTDLRQRVMVRLEQVRLEIREG
ncbi:mycothiol system anti-sigma-R factor [Nocardioides nanhaiensis]|uniref:Putative zinc-finger domain-containing protein n=1 Tax=Nocardioides nanhaiensis TaxID=1476871 RepID=A0ABP8W2A1_9ACTN